ncbi:TPA: HU family DNA-binding protein [Streptococcus suis]
MKYGKKDLINKIAELGGYKKNESEQFLEVVLESIRSLVVEEGDVLDVRKFAKFEKVLVPARTYRNPQTGEVVEKEEYLKTKVKLRF